MNNFLVVFLFFIVRLQKDEKANNTQEVTGNESEKKKKTEYRMD